MKRRKIAVMGLVLCLVSGIFSACGDAAKKDAVASGESGGINLYYDAGSDGSLSGADTFAGSEGTGRFLPYDIVINNKWRYKHMKKTYLFLATGFEEVEALAVVVPCPPRGW